MAFVALSSLQSPPAKGTKFEMIKSDKVTRDGTVKPGKEGDVFAATFQSVDMKTGLVTFTFDANDQPFTTGWKAGVYWVKQQDGGRRRRRRGTRRARKTRKQ
jgi:hypothetical protein